MRNFIFREEKGKRKMKFFSRACCSLLFGLSSSLLYAQSSDIPSVSLNVKNATLSYVLEDIHKQSGYDFVLSGSDVKQVKGITFSIKRVPLETALKELLKDSDLAYRIENKTIIIYRKPASQKEQTAEKNERKISGRVKDMNGDLLPGVSVSVKGKKVSAVTDLDGEWTMTLTDEKNPILVFSFVGMKTLELPYKGEPFLNITLEENVTKMDEVVVTGMFNKPRESYTGSVTTITSKELKMFRGQNMIQTLGNIDPSFNIVQNNSLGSNPNNLPEVNIRGNSSLPTSLNELEQGVKAQLNAPLVIMDGFEISLQKLMDFNDEEIESINLLKDASATAIYGSRGSNGVIVVTTKKPEAGKLKLLVRTGIQLEVPDLTSYDLLNAWEKLDLEKRMGFYDGIWDEEYYNSLYKSVVEGTDTYWLSKPLHLGVGQVYNVRLEGGNQEFRWSGTVGYKGNTGVMKNSFRNVLDASLTLSYTMKNFLFQNQLSITNVKSSESNYGDFSEYVQMNPYWRPYDENGQPYKTFPGHPSEGSGDVPNPLYNASLNTKDESKDLQVINNFSMEWNILDGLLARAQIGISKNLTRSDEFKPASHTDFQDLDYTRKGKYVYGIDEGLTIDGNLTLSYAKTLAEKHALYGGLNYSISQSDSYGHTFTAEGFPDEEFDDIANAIGYAQGRPTTTDNVSRRIGLTANFNYTYDNRYYMDVSYRMDGSSQFGSDKKFAPFWSVGVGWNVHYEDFMKRQNVISHFRIKASAGETGSQQFSPYQAKAMYRYNFSDRYGIWSGAYLSGLGNEDLTWQSTTVFNGGIELGLWDNRVNALLDVYVKKTTNLLSEMDVPLSTGFSSFTENVGSVRNNGFEASLSAYVIRDTKNGIIWSITGKMAYNKNKIVELSEALKQQTERAFSQGVDVVNLLYEGHSTTSIYAVPSLGIDPSCGEEIFLDKNNNRTYKWQADSRRLVGDSEPKYRGNISSLFSYKDLTVNLSFAYHWGGQQYNNTILNRVEVSRSQILYNVDRRVYTDRWMKPGDVVPYKKVGIFPTRMSSRFVQDDNMFSLQSVSVSYRWHSDWLRKNLKLQSVTFNANMSDLFYFSTIKRERGTSYPYSRQMLFDISFLF